MVSACRYYDIFTLIIWRFESYFVSLPMITTNHDAFGHQSYMKNVAIISCSMFSLLHSGVTPRFVSWRKGSSETCACSRGHFEEYIYDSEDARRGLKIYYRCKKEDV